MADNCPPQALVKRAARPNEPSAWSCVWKMFGSTFSENVKRDSTAQAFSEIFIVNCEKFRKAWRTIAPRRPWSSEGRDRTSPPLGHGLRGAMVCHAFRNLSQLAINISENAWAVEWRFTFSDNVLPNIFQTQPQARGSFGLAPRLTTACGGQWSTMLFGISRNC